MGDFSGALGKTSAVGSARTLWGASRRGWCTSTEVLTDRPQLEKGVAQWDGKCVALAAACFLLGLLAIKLPARLDDFDASASGPCVEHAVGDAASCGRWALAGRVAGWTPPSCPVRSDALAGGLCGVGAWWCMVS